MENLLKQIGLFLSIVLCVFIVINITMNTYPILVKVTISLAISAFIGEIILYIIGEIRNS